MANYSHKAIVLLNAMGFVGALIWLYKVRDWEPAVTSIALFATLVGVIVRDRSKAHSSVGPQNVATSDANQSQKATSVTKEKEESKYIIDYEIAEEFVPEVTTEELDILRRFSRFPRSQYTQGYRLDWIYNELINDIPASTLHLLLESLVSKGHLERWTTKQGSTFYLISNNGGRFLVENHLIEVPKV